MTTAIRWLRNSVLILVVLLLLLYMAVRVFVGGVNIPVLGNDFDASAVGNRISAAEGFSISLYAEQVDNARLLRFTNEGDLLVANSNLDQIVLLPRDADGDGKADGKRVLLTDLNGPNGMDFFEDWLYVAETDAIGRVRFDHQRGVVVGSYERIVTGLPDGGNHWRKTLRFGPDGLMYVTMGSSCNVCEEQDPRRGTMVRYRADGSGEEIYARGLRNSAGFDWSPKDGQIYATDNGRDMLGDDFPHCELNKVVQGAHYGWPYANDDNIPDPDFGAGMESLIAGAIVPSFKFQPHNAPLGIAFIRGDTVPADYRGAAIVALHGSWNRTEKDGYKVVSMHWDQDNNVTERDFVTGLLQGDDAIGRPVDIAEGPDGAIYISDDYANVIYRVAYAEPQQQLDMAIAATVFNAEQSLAAIAPALRVSRSAQGAALFEQYQCASCHGADGIGMKPLLGLGKRFDLPALAHYIERPNPPMPIFPLDLDQRQALAVYLLENYSE